MKRFTILIISVLLINNAFSQDLCNNIKVISPIATKPTEPVVTITCSSFGAQWAGESGQSFVFTAIKKDAATNVVIDTTVINTATNSVTIPVNPGMAIRWQVEAITMINGGTFYSYPLRGGKIL